MTENHRSQIWSHINIFQPHHYAAYPTPLTTDLQKTISLQHILPKMLAILFWRGVVAFAEDRIEVLQRRIAAHLRDLIDVE